MITKTMRVEEAVKQRPHIVELLSKHNIDFCCGGWQILEDSVKKQGLVVDNFVE